MIIPVAMPTYRRTTCLQKTLDYLKLSMEFAIKQDPSIEFCMVFSSEPNHPEVIEILKNINFTQSVIYINDHRLGLNINSLISLEKALEIGEVVIYTTDDAAYSEDFLWFAISMLRKYREDDSVLHISSYFTNFKDNRTDKIYRKYGAFICDLTMWKNRFGWFKSIWPKHNPHISFDVDIYKNFPKDKCCIGPIVSRSKPHCKDDGTFYKKYMHDGPRTLWAGDFQPVTSWEESEWIDNCWLP